MKMQSGGPPRGLKEGAAILGGILFSLGAGFLYQKLTALQIGAGAYTYSLSYTIPVVLCAAGVYFVAALRIRRVFVSRTAFDETPEDISGLEEDGTAQPLPEQSAYDLPEFSDEEPVLTAAEQRAEKIASVLAAQRTEQTLLPVEEEISQEGEDAWDALYKPPASEEAAAIRDLYADLPTELPPGYVLPQEAEAEEEKPQKATEEETKEEYPSCSPFREILAIVCILAAFAVVLLLAASTWTKAGEGGIRMARMGRVREYSWGQVTSYTVDAGFPGGELLFTFQMEDGRQVKITPSSYTVTEAFADQYENLYQYWLHADNKLCAAGADKTIDQAEYLADTYMSREDDSWDYVRQIIGYEEEMPWQD